MYLLPVERKKANVRRRPLQFPPRNQDRARKPEHTAATPSEPALSRGRSVSVKRSIRGKGNHGSIARQPCRCYLKSTCTRTLCEYWHPPKCQFYKNATGCKAGDRCLFPHYKVDEQPNKKQKKGHFPKGRESEDKSVVAIVKSVSQLSCVSQDSDALVSQETKEFREDPMQKVLNAIRKVRFTRSTLRQASIREKKGPSLGKINVVPRQRSTYAMEFEERSHEETGRQQRCVQSKAWDLAKKYIQAQRERQGYILLTYKEVVLPSASSTGSCERVCS